MVAELGLGWACPPSHPGSSPVMRGHGRLFRELPLITRKAHEEKPSQADLDPFAHTPLASLAIHDWPLEMRRSAPYSVALGASQTQPGLTHRLLDQYNQIRLLVGSVPFVVSMPCFFGYLPDSLVTSSAVRITRTFSHS